MRNANTTCDLLYDNSITFQLAKEELTKKEMILLGKQ